MKKFFFLLLLALQFTVATNVSLADEPEPRCFPCPTADAR